jgi:ribose 5-phosphate isomerase B
MKIAIGADHAGFRLKERLRNRLAERGHEVVDSGTSSEESADYPDFAEKVAGQVARGEADRGILVCSTGVGMSIAANKVRGIRAALAVNPEEVALVRSHNDANVLALGARYTAEPEAEAMVDVFLSTPFEGGRHARRIGKIAGIENKIAGERE